MTQRVLLILLSVSIWALSGVLGATNIVTNLRLWRAPDHTRLVLDLTKPADHRVFTLTNPSRVVVDLEDANLFTALDALELTDSGVGSVRAAQRENGGLRVVLDLTEALSPRSFVLPPNEQYGHRLVIDLQREDDASTTVQAAREVRQAQTGGQRDIIIAIDAGHGGEDPGAIGRSRTFEKNVVLAIARELEALVEATPGYTPFMVRTGDYYISLVRRRQLAREANADFFVSVHADAFTSPQPSGASVYALSDRGATSTMASYLAESENAADTIGGVGGVNLESMDAVVRSVIVDLAMTHSMQEGLTVGSSVLGQLRGITRLHKPQVEQAGFAVLRSPDVPSILVETGFMSNAADERNLGSQAYRRRLAQAIFNGIKDHFDAHPPPNTWVYAQRANSQTFSSYTVRSGDTLSGIAARHRVSLSRLREINNMNSDIIRVGQVLRVPSG